MSGRQRHHDRLPRKPHRPCTAATVYVCEGEKTADAARSLGLVAVTSMNGALSPDKTDWTPLAGKIVVILPDHDEPGRKYAKAVAAILAKLSPTPVVKIVELPGLTDGDDLVEWIAAHGDELEHVKAVDVWKHSKGAGESPTSPIEPVAERHQADDTTVESLAGLLRNQPRGLLVARDELAGWMGGFVWYANGKGGRILAASDWQLQNRSDPTRGTPAMTETLSPAPCCNSCPSAVRMVCGEVNTPMYTRRRSLWSSRLDSFTEREHVCHRSHQPGKPPETKDTG